MQRSRAAKRTSQYSAWIRPMPAQAPLMAAIIGFGDPSAWCIGRRPVRTSSPAAALRSNAAMSIPGQNAVPAPVTTMARTSAAAAASSSRVKYWCSIATLHAFLRSGLCRVTVATPPATS